ncbi:hypothetical protein K457DRAFT_1216694 [Linnemannia elongata AG-77]|uniref:Uncharacterized protein n=1 Tax=Linnemannia elongata AG-77 TaxID=1314771 RepID=A0A197JAQ0_9FUNG|nr:hypothetical protein K457DRAFT_1216694 [Linnemannia elongata AG-77]
MRGHAFDTLGYKQQWCQCFQTGMVPVVRQCSVSCITASLTFHTVMGMHSFVPFFFFFMWWGNRIPIVNSLRKMENNNQGVIDKGNGENGITKQREGSV